MKGITPVIAIILLLLITISLVGFAFIYFTRVTEIAAARTQEQLENVINAQQMVVVIDNVVVTAPASTTLTIRNVGAQNFDANAKVSVYIDNVLVPAGSCTWSPADIAAGGVSSCAIAGTDCTGKVVRVTSPGGQDSQDC